MHASVNALGLLYYLGRGYYQAGKRIFRELNVALPAVEAWPQADRARAALLLARVRAWPAPFNSLLGERQAGIRLLEEGSTVLDEQGQTAKGTARVRAHFALQWGYLLLYPDPEEARRRNAQSLELYRQVGAPEEAEQTLAASLSLHQEMGNRNCVPRSRAVRRLTWTTPSGSCWPASQSRGRPAPQPRRPGTDAAADA